MAENSQSSPIDDTLSTTITISATHIDIENPYYLHSSDGTGTSLIGTPLVGIDNYTSWALTMTMALRGRNKFCFVDGTLAMPDVSHPDHTRWQRDAAIVWSDLKDPFFTANGPRIFELERRIATLRQNDTSIAAYHTMLCSLWDELIKSLRSSSQMLMFCSYCLCHSNRTQALISIFDGSKRNIFTSTQPTSSQFCIANRQRCLCLATSR
nr:Retrovirus-related Pol polyprotein from transposon RE1 [Ipomoea batatas]